MGEYKEFHIHNVVIDNESSGPRGLDVDVKVSSNKECIIHLGKSMTIRTSWNGLGDLRQILDEADKKICEIIWEKEANQLPEDEDTEEFGEVIASGTSNREWSC